MIRNRYNQTSHLTQDTTWESDKNTRNITRMRAKRSAVSQQVTTRQLTCKLGQHISDISSNVAKTTGFHCVNLAFLRKITNEVAYKTLALPKMKYAAPFGTHVQNSDSTSEESTEDDSPLHI